MLERVRRAMIAAAIVPRVTLGSTRLRRSPPPVAGNHPRWRENVKISRSPSQKLGIATPSSATAIEATPSHELRPSADRRPSGMPSAIATAMLESASCAVLPTFSAISVATGRRLRIEVPRSPRAALPTKRPYCWRIGSSRWSCARMRAIWSGLVTNSASIIFTGSPGTRNSMLKTASVTPKRTGTTARTRRATKISTPETNSPGLAADRGVAQDRIGVEVVLDALHPGAERPHRELVDQRHGECLLQGELLDREVEGPPLRRIRLAPPLGQHLVELGVLHTRPVEVAADERGVEEREEAVGIGGAQEHHRPVGRAAIVVLVPGRAGLGLDLHVDPDVAERGLDELGGGIGSAPVLDGVQDDLEPLPALRPDAVAPRLPARLAEEGLGLLRVERVGLAQQGIVEHYRGERGKRLEPGAPIDRGEERVLVHGVVDRTPHPHVIERRLGDVEEPDSRHARPRQLLHADGGVLLEAGQRLGGHQIDALRLAALER